MVFDHSQIGDRFYFVLSGSVTVEKPEVILLSHEEKQKRRA
jgi:CRP-like cAMP-binding protein